MKKKLLVLIISIVVVVLIGGTFLLLNRSNETSTDNESPNQNNNVDLGDNDNNNDSNDEGNDNVNNAQRVLVLYFSRSGNTETVANFIHDNVGGDIIELETEQNYPSSYNELLDFAQREQRNGARPTLKTNINLDNYDVIFLGYPNWWGDMPMPIYTLLDNYDFSNKTIAPFITHGGSGLSSTPSKIRSEEPNATITEGLAISGSSVRSSQSTVNEWIERIGY